MTSEFIKAAEENKEATRRACGNKGIEFNSLADADFGAVCDKREREFRAKAASVKSDEARAKWNAIADVWAAK